MRGWAEPSGTGQADSGSHEEIARIERAIRGMDEALVEELGGYNGCLERLVELKDRSRSAPPATMIDTFAGWRSIRFPGGTP